VSEGEEVRTVNKNNMRGFGFWDVIAGAMIVAGIIIYVAIATMP